MSQPSAERRCGVIGFCWGGGTTFMRVVNGGVGGFGDAIARQELREQQLSGAVHGFMRSQEDPKPTRDLAEEAANLAATKDAWPRTVDFLKRNLGVYK
jgi:dienelactone hydrolase